MQAKISIGTMRRSRFVRYEDLFLGRDPKAEVRAQWSSLFQAFTRNKFMITLDMAQVTSGGRDVDEITDDYTKMFDRMEEWCDINCSGLWSIRDNEEDLDQNATEVSIEVHLMFELEEDLMRFIKDCAILMKLSY